MGSHRPSFRHRAAAMLLAVWFAFLAIAVPRAGSTQTGIFVQDIILDTAEIKRQVESALKDSFGFQAQLAIVNALQFFGERLAYETAVWLASGGKAQSQLFDRRGWKDFLVDSAFGAGLQFVDDMDKFAGGQLGFEGGLGVAQFVCAPSPPQLRLAIKLGLQDRLKPRQPLCTWNQFKDNWEQFTSRENLANALSGIGLAFEPGESDLSAGLELHVGLGEKQAQIVLAETLTRNLNKQFKSLDDNISGLVKTPASVVSEKLNESIVRQVQTGKRMTAEGTQQALSSIDTFVPMLSAAGQALAINFAVTLVSQTLQQQVLNKGLFLGDLFKEDTNQFAAPPAARAQQARTAYAELQRPRYVSSGSYDQLSEFASCDPSRRQSSTCVIDDGFTQAVRRADSGKPMTVAEAVTAGFLHKDWPLIKEGTAKDQDPNCSRGPPAGGYCASNLKKLRRARVVPIGWELAANHEANAAGRPVTLAEAIAAFHANGRDGTCGTNDAEESPFCGLIDPSWVLRYPIQECRLRAPGELLLEPNTNVRAEVCVDAPSCLETDAEGKCVGGYGYCVREENIWHLSGQSCPAQAASCRALTSREGAPTAVLTSTIDRSVCTAENAGCRWYAASRDAADAWNANDRRYFNRLVEQCQATDEGCTELVATGVARKNLIVNASFERDENGDGQPDGWTVGSRAQYSTDGSVALDGQRAVRVTYCNAPLDWRDCAAIVANASRPAITGGKTYVLSATARSDGAGADRIRILAKLIGAGGSAVPIAGMRTTCNTSQGGDATAGDGGHPNGFGLYVESRARSPQRGSCVFTAPPGAERLSIDIVSGSGPPVWVDAVQLEEAEVPSAFHEGYDAQAPRTYLKAAPDDQRCYDLRGDGSLNTDNDPRDDSCARFARGCTAADVGCERFTPQDGSGIVTGQFSDIDRCPAACVGYAAYREVESAFDQKNAFDFFIPETARQCAAQEVGCSEFTNLDALERGGESREYFTFLRRCEKPSETQAATYYTWEGSDTQGYQLRSFVLKRSQSGDTEIAKNSAPQMYDGSGDCAANYGKRVGEVGYDAEITPDCRAFYSQNGTIHYRRLSRTVLVTDDCVRYRVSHAIDATACGVATGGLFSPTGGCTYKGQRQESVQCTAAAAGCRAYRGNTSGAIQTILATDFEQMVNGDFRQGWYTERSAGVSTGELSLESLTVGGRSLRVPADEVAYYPLPGFSSGLQQVVGGMDATTCQRAGGTAGGTAPNTTCTLPLLRPGGTYELVLVGKGGGAVTAKIMNRAGGTTTELGTFVNNTALFGTDWQRRILGPLIIPTSVRPTAEAYLSIRIVTNDVSFDSIILRETPQATTVIKRSWRTPAVCDRASIAENAPPLAQGMLGCRAYTTRQDTTEYLRSFTRLCSAGVVGCTAFHDTQNSAESARQTFNNPSPDPSDRDDVTVSADSTRYLVDDRARYCTATAKGCTRFGKPTLNVAGDRTGSTPTPGGWGDAFLLDQPDRYEGAGRILCEDPELFCEEYRGNDGTVLYFKDPGNRTCEFKEGALLDGVQYRGWFKTGKADPLEPCDERYLIGNTTYGVWRNADVAASGQPAKYDGWVGLCEAGHDQCTEFVDPTDRTLEHPNGKSYTALRPTVDLASCQGSVSRKEGCVILQDQSSPGTHWSAESSFALSDVQQGIRVPAVDCTQNPEQCKRCVVERACRAADGSLQDGTATRCLADSECKNDVGFTCRGGEIGPACADVSNDCTRFSRQAVCSDTLPVPQQLQNNGNAVVKVQRDRACGQWLACRSATEAWDPSQGRMIEVCESIDLCESSVPDTGGSQALRCERWVSGEETSGKVLTRPLYQGRNRTWSGLEYSGYSVTGMYQSQELVPVNVSIYRDQIDQRLVRVDPRCWGSVDTPMTVPGAPTASPRSCTQVVAGEEVRDAEGTCDGLRGARDDPNTAYDDRLLPTKCGTGGRGVCVNHRCVYGVDGSTLGIGVTTGPAPERALPLTCRAFPERDAPFPDEVAEFTKVTFSSDEEARVRTGSKPNFTNVNVCDSGEGMCGCGYQKVKVGDQTKYFGLARTDVPSGICDGGFDEDGKSKAGVFECQSNAGCSDERDMSAAIERAIAQCMASGQGVQCIAQVPNTIEAQRAHGQCKTTERRERFFGFPGICLERDMSITMNGDANQHPCVAWYPVQQLAGGIDLYNQYEQAGFHEKAQYCTGVTRYEYRRKYDGLSIPSCIIGGVGAGCVLGCGPNPACVVGCLLAGASIGGYTAGNACDDSDYEFDDWDADWGPPWDKCPPYFDIDFRCRPKGKVGWHADPGGSIDHAEDEAYRCTDVVQMADQPTPNSMNNKAWTDRVRERRNLEEEILIQSAVQRDNAKPEIPLRYKDTCGVFGQLPPEVNPDDVRGGNATTAYWELFPDDRASSQSCTLGYSAMSTLFLPVESADAGKSVASAARYFGGYFTELYGLFAKNLARWRWQSTTQESQCSVVLGSEGKKSCTRDSECREEGDCNLGPSADAGICRMVAGRCAIGGLPTGAICEVNSQCGAGGVCMRAKDSNGAPIGGKCRASPSMGCNVDANCGSGGKCDLGPIVFPGESGPRECRTDANCVFSPLRADAPNGVCSAGCWNPSSRGGRCTSNADCTLQGTCDSIPQADVRERSGEFVDESPYAWDALVLPMGSGASPEPQIASIGGFDPVKGYSARALGRFTVNEEDDDDVDAPGGQATVRFFGWANRNQMPITKVEIDWGDGTSTLAVGKYQNHKPVCATGDDLGKSALHCENAPELTCDSDHGCPSGGVGAGRNCKGNFCRLDCAADTDCPAGSNCIDGACARDTKRCLLDIDQSCANDAACLGENNRCLDEARGSVIYDPGSCTMRRDCRSGSGEGTCVGETSFGDSPDACTASPFTYRHTYRCEGVTDPAWDNGLGGCTFVPRVRLIDNWGWCTNGSGSGRAYGAAFCESNDAFIDFQGKVIVR